MGNSIKTNEQLLKEIRFLKEENAALVKSKEIFQIIAENTNDNIAITSFDLKATYIYVSPSVKNVLGYEPNELIGKSFFSFIHPEDKKILLPILKEHIKNILKKILRKDKSTVNKTIEFRFKNKNGDWVYMQSTVNFIGDNLLSVTRDISKQKQIEINLRASESRYKLLFDGINDAVFIHPFQDKGFSNFYEVNEVACKRLGYTREELLQLSPKDISLIDDVRKQGTTNSRKQLKKKQWAIFNITHITKKGKHIPVEISSRIFNLNGENVLMSLARDISKRIKMDNKLKENENKFRLLADNTNDWEYLINKKGEYIYLSPSCERITGYKSEEFIAHPNLLSKIIRPDYISTVSKHLKEEYKNKHGNHSIEFPIITKQGHERWVEHNCGAAYDENGEYVGRRGNNRDITERKLNNEKILKLTTAVEQSANSIVITDIKGNIEYTNPKFTDLTGYTAAEMLDANPRILNAQTQNKEYYNQMWDILSSGKTWKGEFHNKKKNGELFWENVTITPLKNEKGIIINYLAIKEDITEKKQAEEEIRKLNTAVKQSPAIIMITSLDGRIEYINPKYTEVTGYSLEESIGKLPNILKSGELPPEIYIDLWNKITSGESWKGKFHNKKKNGDLFWESVSISPIFDKKGEAINYIKVSEDITERIRNEQIQKVLFNISNAVNTTTSLKKLIGIIQKELGSIIDTTNFYVALYNSKNNTISSPYMADEKDSFTDFPAGKTLTYYVIRTGKPLFGTKEKLKELTELGEIETIGTHSKIWLGVPLKTDGKVFGIYAVQSYRDENAFSKSDMEMLKFIAGQISISIERKRAEDDLLLALKKAEESDQLKSAFLANMSHEIRTPMNGILGFTSLLQDPDLTKDELREYSAVIERNGARMLETVNNLIDISKIEAGQMKTFFSQVNITKQIKNLYDFFKPEADAKNLKLSYTLPKSQADFIFKTDEIKLHGILSNLIKNAIKYTDKGSVNFGFKIEENHNTFYVKDTGIGIPIDKQDIIFNRFVQADLSLASKYEGAGLGLSIAKAYTEMLDGKIWLKSEINSGSTFFFEFPDTCIPDTVLEEVEINQKKTKKEFREIKMLIAVNDQTSLQNLHEIKKIINTEQVSVETEHNIVEACLARPDFNLVLLDIDSIETNGLSTIKKIREFNKDIIIIIIGQTTHTLKLSCKRAMQSGCNECISKPITEKKLLTIINKYFTTIDY